MTERAVPADFSEWDAHRLSQAPGPHQTLTDDECDEMTRLFNTLDLPETAMNFEMADGYITCCALGPEAVEVADWMAGIFGQNSLPICSDLAQQEALLSLLLRHHATTVQALNLQHSAITQENAFVPLMGEVLPQACIRPYQLDADGARIGDWHGKEWARGFQLALLEDPDWEVLVTDRGYFFLLSPFVILSQGFNPDKRDYQLDDDPELISMLVNCLYGIRQYWDDFLNTSWLPPVRPRTKVGRNDPCPCGSGKKHKKCCAA